MNTLKLILAVALLTAGSAQANDLYIDRPMPSYQPPTPPVTIDWEECAAEDSNGVQSCFTLYSNGREVYYYIYRGFEYSHYPQL